MAKKNETPLALFEKFREEIRLSRTGRFYKLPRALTKAEHEQLIEDVREDQVDAEAQRLSGLGGPELMIVRSSSIGTWTSTGPKVDAYGTLYLQPVLVPSSVATVASGLKELRFAHVLILEGAVKSGTKLGQHYAFVNCDILEDPLRESGLVDALSRAELVNPFLSSSLHTNDRARIEELSMRMMNMSRVGLRRKTLEAYDVEASVSSLGLHRSIPGTMKLRLPRDAGVGTAVTISAGRQSVRAGSSRVKLSTVTQWFAQCVVRLNAENGVRTLQNSFLAEMAEPLDTLDGIEPSSLLLDFAALEESGYGITSHGHHDGSAGVVDDDSHVYAAFDDPIVLTKVVPPPSPAAARSPASSGAATKAAAAAAPAAAAAAVAAALPSLATRRYKGEVKDKAGKPASIYVEVQGDSCRLLQANPPVFGHVNGAGGLIPFEQAVTRAKALRVAFDGGRVLYSAEGAHRSGNLKLAIHKLLLSMRGVTALATVTTEKGDDVIKPAATLFPAQSCFDVIEKDSSITTIGSTLVCGDSDEEIFDYLDIVETPPRLRWLHGKVQRKSTAADRRVAAAANKVAAKTGAAKTKAALKPMGATRGSLSASGLQEVVGQAIKNLAFLRRDPSDPKFNIEVQRWTGKCDLPFPTQIDRLRRGTLPGDKVKAIISDVSALQEVAIVIPSYSKGRLVGEFGQIESGNADQHTIQLFWLLSGFASSCLEVGVTPLIFLRN